eukprot:5538572-Amphidinium_carterae.1
MGVPEWLIVFGLIVLRVPLVTDAVLRDRQQDLKCSALLLSVAAWRGSASVHGVANCTSRNMKEVMHYGCFRPHPRGCPQYAWLIESPSL